MPQAKVDPPRVSVVMPVHNGARWLDAAVASVLGQSLRKFELVVIDDGSTDATPEILAAFAARDGRVRIVRQDHLGLIAALNRGLAEARAPLLARLDADDLAARERLERQAAFLDAHPEVGVVGSWADRIDADGAARRGPLTPKTQSADLRRDLERTNPFVHSSIMARTELLRRLGGYRAAFEAAEDYDLWLRAGEAGELANLPECLVSYRVHGASVTRRRALRQSFSVRLAQRSAAARREAGRDPADALAAAPDWNAPGAASAFYAEDAALYRLLDVDAGGEPPDFTPLVSGLARFNHAERRLAAIALIHYAGAGGARSWQARRLVLGLVLRRPSSVARATWSLWAERLTGRAKAGA